MKTNSKTSRSNSFHCGGMNNLLVVIWFHNNTELKAFILFLRLFRNEFFPGVQDFSIPISLLAFSSQLPDERCTPFYYSGIHLQMTVGFSGIYLHLC